MSNNKFNPKVSLISVNYNQAKLTAAFIDSALAMNYKNIEIVIVDNASKEDCSWLSETYPMIKLVRSDKNNGFAAGNLLGFQHSTGDYLFLVNNDTEVAVDCMAPLLSFAEKNADFGMLGPRILYAKAPHDVQFAGGQLMRYSARVQWRNKSLSEQEQNNLIEETDLIHGAAMFVSRKVIDNVGFMETDYFLLYEEFDWCERIKRAGYPLYYIGASKIYHHSSATMKDAPFKRYYMSRNRLLFIRRNFRGLQRISSILFFCCLSFPLYFIKNILLGRFKLSMAAIRGVIWHLKPNLKSTTL